MGKSSGNTKKRVIKVLKNILFVSILSAGVSIIDQTLAGSRSLSGLLDKSYIIHIIIWMSFGWFIGILSGKKVI